MPPDTATLADTTPNVFNEPVCGFTGIAEFCCSHCAGLPWETECDWDE
jgi:hypothetical protein